jgi:glutamate carboxypeptidase
LRDLVELESPTGDEVRLRMLGDRLTAELEAHGLVVERRGAHLVAAGGPDDDRAPLLLLAHMDTVWPAGTLARMPFRVADGYAWGPGAFDMKAGIVMALEALAAARPLERAVRFAITADEEIGSPVGRTLIEPLAVACEAALVLEPPVSDGTITTARFGLARYQLAISGRAAHAGHPSSGGVSAVEELAHQVLAVHALGRGDDGVRVNVGQVGGGTADNVVAGEAWARIDARAWTAEGQARLEGAIHALEPALAGAAITVSGGITRPPMRRSPRGEQVAEHVVALAAGLGVPLAETASGGGSDGNFAAAAGAPTVDGLGPAGAGAHAPDERVSLRSLEERTELLAELLHAL